MKTATVIVLLLLISAHASMAHAQDLASEVTLLRQLLVEIQTDYESRISELELRLGRAERLAGEAKRDAEGAFEIAEQTSIDQSSGTAAANIFNPALGMVLSGRYARVGQGWEEIPGFLTGGEIGTGESGFSLGEAEFNLKANVDSRFFGNLTFALHDESDAVEVELEEAWIQATNLSAGFSLIGGRFFSASGYLNKSHRHADDFTDRPLPYQAFFGGQYRVDGLQARWIAPASLLIELGTEMNWGGSFPASANRESAASAWTLFAKIGGDFGVSNSWQVGLSWITADAIDRGTGHDDGLSVAETFSGDSDLSGVDFVWKWAPGGNSGSRSFKLQGEYFSRSEKGFLVNTPYNGDQRGWYLQGLWQFAPQWRLGLRHDIVDADNRLLLTGTTLDDPDRSSSRDSLMFDWSASEFSRLRLQYINDRVLPDTDHQWFLQYIMSVGAHGAHDY